MNPEIELYVLNIFTLAETIAVRFTPEPIYLDLKNPFDQAKLSDPEDYFERNEGRLIILDEIQRFPELFSVLRGVIDRRRRQRLKSGQFLILGSASLDLLKQSLESLPGRIACKELSGFNAAEVALKEKHPQDRLWLRGGFPDSFLAKTDDASIRWRLNFISTYLERGCATIWRKNPGSYPTSFMDNACT